MQATKEYHKQYYLLNKEKILARIKKISKTDEFKKKRRIFNRNRKEKNRVLYYKRKYGISIEEYNRKLLAQNGCCAICKIPESKLKHGRNQYLAVDHDHKTGKVRGLLCYRCNSVLGFIDDDRIILSNCISYLNIHA